jgi:signal transduction histidine kinase
MLRNLKNWQRLLLLSGAFILPVVALLYFLVREQGLAIDFGQKELVGVQYLRAIRPLLADLLDERDFRAAVQAGDTLRIDQAAKKTEALKRDFEALDRVGRSLPVDLDTDAQREALRRAWDDPTDARDSGATTDSVVLKELLRHLVVVGNNSNLVLDPDVDTYYCMDAVVFKLPKLFAELSDARGQAFEIMTRTEKKGGVLADADREVFRGLAVGISEAQSIGRDNMEFGLRFNPVVEQRLRPLLRKSDEFTDAVVQTLSGNRRTARSASTFFADVTGAIEANFQSYDATMDVLERLLHIRIQGFQQRRIVSFAVLAVSLLVSLSVVFSLQREVESRTEDLSTALNHIKLTQAQLVRSEKMAALGNLVAGISHEINTPIGIGVTAATSLDDETMRLEDLAKSGKLKRSELDAYIATSRELSGLVLSNLNRASSLIQSFKQVAVDQSSENKRRFLVKGYLDEILQSLHPRLKKTRLDVEVQCNEELELHTYPGAFSQIVTNFVTNSIVHAYEPDDRGKILIQAASGDGIVRFTYSDDGKGIPGDHLDKIFDPFFTTKRAQGGSGLGLNIVYNLVTQKLKGQIRCESTEGKGTTFVMEIPNLN